ncbi:hypothetical protein K505DRAFT_410352 [Melanomma pulvis-pyrius CBS 109.77]|uniref:Aminoglycoside phosphotransferase domain-containing protein n=1 Tax=Melanomma pulvis-pyrius CBS 109.77 TaxID=1314802 RepID=A0A6A6WZQ3_9PLEO|nr:hypothetical protein K505DRAFT_410352 [Melanomma pulvis-pyrius CBS 109.77]
MNPPIEDSVVCTRQNHWLLGSLYVCELVNIVPGDADSAALGDSEASRCHHAGTSAAVWSIGGTYIKVKAWRDDMQLESDTIRFVNRTCSVATPKVIFSWVDADWNRSFLIMKALEGQTLDQAWESLSTDQRMQIAQSVAQSCRALALSTSETLMTADGNGVLEPFLRSTPRDSEPSWKPQLLGPFSLAQLQSYLSQAPVIKSQAELFYFYHADLGPSNIIVRKDDLVGIIDWESAAFYPRFWLGTKPLISPGFSLRGGAKRAWAHLLVDALEREGFPSDMQKYQTWKQAVRQ